MRPITLSLVLPALAIAILAMGGCPSNEQATDDQPGGDEQPAGDVDGGADTGNGDASDDIDTPPDPLTESDYDGPPFDAAIEVMESMPEQYAANWQVTVPTLGWTLQEDRIEHEGTLARVYLTLVKPAPDEVVGQMLEEKSGRYDAGTQEIARLEIYVNFHVRGEAPDEPDYQLAAVAP